MSECVVHHYSYMGIVSLLMFILTLQLTICAVLLTRVPYTCISLKSYNDIEYYIIIVVLRLYNIVVLLQAYRTSTREECTSNGAICKMKIRQFLECQCGNSQPTSVANNKCPYECTNARDRQERWCVNKRSEYRMALYRGTDQTYQVI